MGMPGDHLRIENKQVILNGKKLVEPYTQHIFPNIEPYRDNFPSEPFGPVDHRALAMLQEQCRERRIGGSTRLLLCHGGQPR